MTMLLGCPELPDIVRQTDQCPLPPDLLHPPQQELPIAAALFDLAEDRLDDRFAPGIVSSPVFRPERPPHPVRH